MQSQPSSSDSAQRLLTRLVDISLSLLGLIALSPVLLVVAVAVKCTSRGPVLYQARRVGKDGRPFHLYKFRSMATGAADGAGVTGSGDPRVTSLGRILRRTKLDELPQLVNTLRGEMSLVGPRPEDPRYVALYSPEQRQVLRVKPGITSAATVLHRHEEELLVGVDFEEIYRREILPNKLRIELDYLSRRTLTGDVRILMQTASALFRKPTGGRANRGPQCPN